jgi:5-methylthioadenosine/S-adenosylhomocysteine deaminase
MMVQLIIKNAYEIVTMDANRRMFRNGAIAVEDGRVVDVGKSEEIGRKYRAERTIDARRMLVIPGLINSHIHTVQQLGRGLMDNVNSTSNIMWKYESCLDDEYTFVSASLACYEMIRTGTTCFGEPGANISMEGAVKAIRNSGLRARVARTTMDVQAPERGPTPSNLLESTDSAVEEAESFYVKNRRVTPKMNPWFSVLLVRTASDQLLRRIKDCADKYGAMMQIHAASTKKSVESCKERFGMTPVERLDKLGILDVNLLLTHMNWLTAAEIDAIRAHNTKVCHCPTTGPARGYGTFQAGRFWDMLQKGIVVGIGSDGAPTSNFLDMVRVMYSTTVHKDVKLDATIFPAQTVLEMATVNGARALMLEDQVGSIEVGKWADITLFDLDCIEFVPNHDLVSNLVHSACGHAADTVIVGGEVLMEHKKVKTIDIKALLASAVPLAESISEKLRRT